MDIIAELLPPAFATAIRRLRGRHHIWKGVYPAFADVPATGPGYESPLYLTEARKSIARLLQVSEEPTEQSYPPSGENDLLPFLAAIVAERAKPFRIVDLGGGLGDCFVHLLRGLALDMAIEYHVVDLPWAVEEGSRIFRDDDRITFHRSIPDGLGPIDVVFSRGALMCIEDYRSAVNAICSCQPSWVLMVNITAGKFPTFASGQTNLRGSVVPHWFFNLDEITELMRDGGYELLLRSPHEDSYDLSAFPPDRRLPGGRPLNLLFARS